MNNIRSLLIICLISFPVHGNDQKNINNESSIYSQSTYGGIGLIETPTARFSEDGEFGFGISTEKPYNRLFAKMQFFPWLEAVLRYTEGTYFPYNTGSPQTWKDKGFDLKVKLFNETEMFPQLAMGFNDFGGTGAYSSEYIVANKKVNNFDFSLGLGWGHLDGLNHIDSPATWFDSNRGVRGGYDGQGGTFSIDKLFSGEKASIFGGFEYFTPIPNLSVKVEYDTTDYTDALGQEKVFYQTGNIFELDSRVNVAVNYRIKPSDRDNIDLSVGFIRGNTIYANMAVHSSLNKVSKPKFIAPKEIINVPYLEPYSSLNNEWQTYLTDLIMWQMGNVGFVTHNLIFNQNEVLAEISQGRFQNPVQAIELASRILANNSPKNIDQITVINIDQGIETLRATIPRQVLVEEVKKGSLNEEFLEFNKLDSLKTSHIVKENDYLYPNFYWELKPQMLGTLQHQVKFYFWQLEALLHTEYSIKKGLYLTTDIGINIANNYKDYTWHVPDGQLEHVRQDRRLYLTEGESGLRKMSLDYLLDLHPNIKARMSVGYLEWMFGGIGGEILYIPNNKRWALGLDTYWVKQREYDQKFSFRDYETVTGFLSYHQDIPIYDMRLKISAGKFLAKDTGVIIDLSRRFKTGARVGGKVALTDCDAQCVGEGSFNKWIYFELPMDLFYTQSNTRARTGYSWSPLTKDAGAKVENGSLYYLMMNATDEVNTLRQKSWSMKKILSGFSTKKHNRT